MKTFYKNVIIATLLLLLRWTINESALFPALWQNIIWHILLCISVFTAMLWANSSLFDNLRHRKHQQLARAIFSAITAIGLVLTIDYGLHIRSQNMQARRLLA